MDGGAVLVRRPRLVLEDDAEEVADLADRMHHQQALRPDHIPAEHRHVPRIRFPASLLRQLNDLVQKLGLPTRDEAVIKRFIDRGTEIVELLRTKAMQVRSLARGTAYFEMASGAFGVAASRMNITNPTRGIAIAFILPSSALIAHCYASSQRKEAEQAIVKQFLAFSDLARILFEGTPLSHPEERVKRMEELMHKMASVPEIRMFDQLFSGIASLFGDNIGEMATSGVAVVASVARDGSVLRSLSEFLFGIFEDASRSSGALVAGSVAGFAYSMVALILGLGDYANSSIYPDRLEMLAVFVEELSLKLVRLYADPIFNDPDILHTSPQEQAWQAIQGLLVDTRRMDDILVEADQLVEEHLANQTRRPMAEQPVERFEGLRIEEVDD